MCMGGLVLIINTLLTIVSGMALLIFVLIISLLFFGAENIIFNIECSNGNLLQPFARLLTGRCGDNEPALRRRCTFRASLYF